MCDVPIKNTNPHKKDSTCIFKTIATATQINCNGEPEVMRLCSLHADIYTSRKREEWSVQLDKNQAVS